VNLAPAPTPTGPSQAEIDHYRAPALVIDLGQYAAPEQARQQATPGQPLDPRNITGAMGGVAQPKGPTGADGKSNPDDAFAQRFGVGESSKPATARHMGNLSLTIVEGAVIPAVLETALNSDLPGYARAVVSRDVRGFDGKAVLVPRGTRLIGQYKSGVAQGQSRAFVIWTRLIRPDGATVDLSSPATDALGRGGLAGDVDNHFLQRFGGAILLSLIDIGVASATAGASNTAIIVAGARTGDTATASIAKDQSIAPTVKVPQGSPVRVFVSQDLDFSTVGAAKAAQ
jgi:type IV secretion system protein VirB10